MKGKLKIKEIFALALLLMSIFAGVLSFVGSERSVDTTKAAAKLERRISKRLQKLDTYADRAVDISPSQWMDLGKVPDDMVIYRYVNDSIQSWVNSFTAPNDEIEDMVMVRRLTNPRAGLTSPLAQVGDSLGYYNIGPKWYLARRVDRGEIKYIIGLEILNTIDEGSFNGVNPRLKLGERYSIRPLGFSGGTAVVLEGIPQFKLLYESLSTSNSANVPLLWVGLLLFLLGTLLLLSCRPSARRLVGVIAANIIVLLLFYAWGRTGNNDYGIFSPTVFAAGRIFYSLGAIMLIALIVCVPVWCLFISRRWIYSRINTRLRAVIWGLFCIAYLIGIVLFTLIAIRSVSLNSNICLEIYKIKEFSLLSAVVYGMALVLMLCVPMLSQLVQASIQMFTGRHGNVFALKNKVAFAVLVSGALVCLTSILGIRKEQSSLEVWANRLTVNRDIALEMQLQMVEDGIASDPMIASLSVLGNAGVTIRNRISEVFLGNLSQEYDLQVAVDNIDFTLLQEGEKIAPQSHFVYKEGPGGLAQYGGLFLYRIENYGVSRVYVTIDRKGDWKYRGYSSIIGATLPGEVMIPSNYSFARYREYKLLTFKGSFAYPVEMDHRLKDMIFEQGESHMNLNGYVHFVYRVSDDEVVLVSRPRTKPRDYAIAGIFLALVAFLGISCVAGIKRRKASIFGHTYYQTRLTWVVMLSLILALVSMALVSVVFVYNRNEANRNTLMSEKINSIQASISARLRGVRTTSDLYTQDVLYLIEDVGNSTNSDVSLYTPGGKIMMSTASALYDRMILPWRINAEAYNNIMNRTSRYYIHKEKIGSHKYYSMYAPLIGDDGDIVAIICSPYTDESYDFETNAITHLLLVLSVFIFLMLCARFMAKSVIQKMFEPLVGMSRKMNAADLDALEHIEYDKEDEVSGLVMAYNRMVDDLSESSRRLAQAERDKAWSGMARQVAHEIKNPLTPMKLQIQRIMRLKANNAPGWEEKLDEVSKVLLDHIDILTETANEFSTFAKLYTEEPTQIDLDKVLQEEISMFDNHDNIKIEYIGMSGAVVMAPKPQLTRVFVNLINNAVQAVEDKEDGQIVVSLRNSLTDGYYDILFEDNGPGVAPENVERLFTPNFTTKSSGTGLGLAISRSILEKCDARISYDKSFKLGGACFTILYPKG